MTFASVLNTTQSRHRRPWHDDARLALASASTVSGLLSQGPRSTGFAGLFGDMRVVAAECAGSMVGRFGWALADQLLSSATNFLLGLLVARTVGARDLGAFSVAYATFTFSLGAVRAVARELLVVRHSALSADEWRDGVKRSAGTALMAGIVIGAGCLIAGAIRRRVLRDRAHHRRCLAAIPVGARRVALRLVGAAAVAAPRS